MDPQLTTSIVALAVVVLGGLGTLVTALIAWLAKKLDTNTAITTQARDASNGRLGDALSRLAAERDRVQGLRWLIRERDDRIAFLTARVPEAEQLLTEYRDRRTRRASELDEQLLDEHLLTPSDESSSRGSGAA